MSDIREPLVVNGADAGTAERLEGRAVVVDTRSQSRNEIEEGIHWVTDMAGDYDFCIVFPAENGNFTQKGTKYCTMLRKLGFEMFGYKG